MTDGSRSTSVRVWPRYGTSTRSESVEVEVEVAAEAEAVAVFIVVEGAVGISMSRGVVPEGGNLEEEVLEEEAKVVLLLVRGRIDGDNDLLLPRPTRAMEITIIIKGMKWGHHGAIKALRGITVEIRGTIATIVDTTDIHLKSIKGDGVEADPLSAMSEIGDAREAGVHMMMSQDAGEVVVEAAAEIGIIGSTTIRTTRRRRIGILLVGGMTTTMAAVGMNERRRRDVIAVEAGPDPEIARRSPRGSIVVEVEVVESVPRYSFILYELDARGIIDLPYRNTT